MIKIFLLLSVFYSVVDASFMDKVGDIVASTLSDNEDEIPEVKTVGTLSVKTKKEKRSETLFLNSDVFESVVDLIDLKEGEHLGLPSVFGLNKKKEKRLFGSKVLGNSILGDMKDTTTRFYRGFKNTGESAEFMSGMMYKSSKMYNGMFQLFDESPMNIFDDKDKRKPSIFDLFDKGNDMLDMID